MPFGSAKKHTTWISSDSRSLEKPLERRQTEAISAPHGSGYIERPTNVQSFPMPATCYKKFLFQKNYAYNFIDYI